MIKFLKFIPFWRGNKNKKNGFTLVETLIAIAIFSVALTAFMGVLASSISNTNFAKQKMTATYLAQEGIEYIRNTRDDYTLYHYSFETEQFGWEDFIDYLDGEGCNQSTGCGFDTWDSFPDLNFIFSCTEDSLGCELVKNTPDNWGDFVDDANAYGDGGVDSGFKRVITIDNNFNNCSNSCPYGDEVKVTSTVSWQQGSTNYHVDFSESLFNWTQPLQMSQ